MTPNNYDPLATFYDLFYPLDKDVNFYLEVVKEAGKKVLELCCGTGRLLIPLAKEGCNITGVDISSNMLAIAKQKINQLDSSIQQRIKLKSGDIRNVNWGDNYDLIIIAFSSFLELPTKEDRLMVLQKCYDSLRRKGGILVMDNFYQDITKETEWGPTRDGRKQLMGSYSKDNEKIDFYESSYFDFETHIHKKTISIKLISESKNTYWENIDVTWPYATPEEIKQNLQQVGFNKIEMFGSFDRLPLYDETLKGKSRQIALAKR